MLRAVGIKIFHIVLFEIRTLDRIVRAKAVLERASRFEVSQSRLHHRAQIPGRVMPELHHLARRAFENDHHSASYVVCL
jgi:hypothetical protein